MSVDALHLTEAVRCVSDSAGQNPVAQHRVDDGGLAVGCAPEKCDFHVVTRQHLANVRYFDHVAVKCLRLGLVDDVGLSLILGEA